MQNTKQFAQMNTANEENKQRQRQSQLQLQLQRQRQIGWQTAIKFNLMHIRECK